MGLIINEDFENFMVWNPPEDMGPEGLRKQIDRYAGKSVSTLIFCGNGMRARRGHVKIPSCARNFILYHK